MSLQNINGQIVWVNDGYQYLAPDFSGNEPITGGFGRPIAEGGFQFDDPANPQATRAPTVQDFGGSLNFSDPAVQQALRQAVSGAQNGRIQLRNQDAGPSDPFTNPVAMALALHNLGITDVAGAMRGAQGLDPAYAQSVAAAVPQIQGARAAAEADSIGDLSNPFTTPEFLAFLGVGAAGTLGLGAEAGASAGGTAATEGTALGTGLTPGTSGVTGLTPGTTATGIGGGAVGTGITTPLAATGPFSLASLAPATAGGTALINAAGGGSASTGGTVAGAASTGGALASLQRVLDNGGTVDDWLKLAGAVAPAALGAFASNKQAESLSDLADKFFDIGAPSRARFESSFAPGFTLENEPGFRDALDLTTKSFLHKASADFGNPAQSPNAFQQTLKDVNSQFTFPALNEFRRLNAGAGGLATLTAAAPSAATSAIGAERGIFDSIGVGAADVFNPPRSLADILRDFKRAGF